MKCWQLIVEHQCIWHHRYGKALSIIIRLIFGVLVLLCTICNFYLHQIDCQARILLMETVINLEVKLWMLNLLFRMMFGDLLVPEVFLYEKLSYKLITFIIKKRSIITSISKRHLKPYLVNLYWTYTKTSLWPRVNQSL